MKTGRRYILLLAVVVIGLSVVGPANGSEGTGSVRSGSILAGIYSTGPWQCDWTPDCAAWLARDCDPEAIAAEDPAVFASIVDVEELAKAGGSWRFDARMNHMCCYGGAPILEFWDADCDRVEPPGQDAPYLMGSVVRDVTFSFPSTSVKWMTVVSSDLVLVDWTLWRAARS